MPNKYVDFISDDDFLECVKWVCDAYPEEASEIDMKHLQRNTLDPFKVVFDMINIKNDFDSWLLIEQMRQQDKTINNRIGDFHQRLLGKVDGWEDLGIGHPLGIDLKNEKETIFIELKNKHNTVKGEDLKHVFDKLEKVTKEHKKSIVYYAYILPKNPGSGEKIWKTSRREPNKRILEAWGARVYEIVTRDSEALNKVWNALPIAIKDLLNSDFTISNDDEKNLLKLFESSLG